jgi:hypothetical protein
VDYSLAWYAWVLNGLGIIFSFIGSVLLFFGGPKTIIGLGSLFVGSEEELRQSNEDKAKERIRKLDRDRALLRWGLGIIAVGFLLQASGWLFSFPSTNNSASVIQNVYK